MSPAMKKPERVEVGQWWAWCNQRGPKRIETIRMYSGRLEAEYGNGHGSVVCQWLIENGEYLGSGEHPEPSEWMIETLAEHAYDIGRARLPPTWGDYLDEKRANWRYCVRRTLSGECDILNEQLTDAILSLYSILRSLGKW